MEENPMRQSSKADGHAAPPWADLPDIALNAVALRLCGAEAFLAFCGVCSRWRSAAQDSLIDLLSSKGPRFLLFLSSTGEAWVRSLSADAGIYKCPSLPLGAAADLVFLGQSNGHLIALDSATRRIPSIVDPLTGARTKFPPLRFGSSFFIRFALITEPTTYPGCMLVLIKYTEHNGDGCLILTCPVGGAKWKMSGALGPVTDAIAFGRLLYIRASGSIVVFNLSNLKEFNFFIGKGKWLVESSNGQLLVLDQKVAGGHVYSSRLVYMKGGIIRTRFYLTTRLLNKMLHVYWQRTDLRCCTSQGKLMTMGAVLKQGNAARSPAFWENFSFQSNMIPINAAGKESCHQPQPRMLLRNIPSFWVPERHDSE